MTIVPLGLAVWLVQATAQGAATPAPPARPAAPAGLSWEEADQIQETVARLERRLKAGKPASRQAIAVTERQINSYVTLELGPKLPPAVSGLRLRFTPGRLAADGTLDLDAVRAKLPQGGAGSLLTMLSGTVPVALRGRLQGANGQGMLEVEEAVVAGISLPTTLVAQLVAQATRSATNPAGFDLLAPFPLPWTASSIRIEEGRAIVEFAQGR
jgi:hypothetical protein